MAQTIAVLDFGSQLTQVIARRIRECQVYSKIYHYSTPAAQLRADGVMGIILSGGPQSVYAKTAPHPDPEIFKLGIPVLGICYGVQLMGHFLGGKVALSKAREYGHGHLTIKRPGKLFAGLPRKLRIWNSHGDKLTKLPPGFVATAVSDNSPYSGIEDAKRRFYGIQFHPEVFHTERGVDMIRNFLVKVCGAKQDWTTKDFIAHSVAEIRRQVGKGRVLLGLSGGVDSSVAAALLHKAIGRQLTCVFVDNGLLRKGERELRRIDLLRPLPVQPMAVRIEPALEILVLALQARVVLAQHLHLLLGDRELRLAAAQLFEQFRHRHARENTQCGELHKTIATGLTVAPRTRAVRTASAISPTRDRGPRAAPAARGRSSRAAARCPRRASRTCPSPADGRRARSRRGPTRAASRGCVRDWRTRRCAQRTGQLRARCAPRGRARRSSCACL